MILGSVLGHFWDHFRITVGASWQHIGITLDRKWEDRKSQTKIPGALWHHTGPKTATKSRAAFLCEPFGDKSHAPDSIFEAPEANS